MEILKYADKGVVSNSVILGDDTSPFADMAKLGASVFMDTPTIIQPPLETIPQKQNNGAYASYYEMHTDWKTLQDVIEERKMNFSQGEILKASFTFNTGRHDGTSPIRDLEKIMFYSHRQYNLERKLSNSKKRVKLVFSDDDGVFPDELK